MNRTADRIMGLALLGLAAFIVAQAVQWHIPYSYDPLGPKAFPIGLASLLAALAVVLLLRPGQSGEWPGGVLLLKTLAALGALLVYALLFTTIGYLSSTTLAVLMLARLFGATWGKAAVSGVLMSCGSYVLFTTIMHIPLPPNGWLMALI